MDRQRRVHLRKGTPGGAGLRIWREADRHTGRRSRWHYGRRLAVRSKNRKIPIASVNMSCSWKSDMSGRTACRPFSASKNARVAFTLFLKYFPYGP